MRTGMLWFDDSNSRGVDEKVMRAAAYYESKYGSMPTLCFVHPSMLKQESLSLGAIEVRTVNTVLPYHFWLGHDGGNGRKQAA